MVNPMHHLVLQQLMQTFNASRVLRDVSTYWNFRSTVPGPALRAASEFLVRRYQENGIPSQLIAYPADSQTKTQDERRNPLAWQAEQAVLEIIEPTEYAGVICDYSVEPLCVLSNSTGTPPEGITAEVVVIHNGASPEAYSAQTVAGKILFTDVWPLQADRLAREHGTVGLITDSVTPPWLHDHPPVRQPADVPDLTMWGVLDGHRNDKPLWGFSLSPRQGAALRQLINQSKTPVRLRAKVDARLYQGTSEVVSAHIPGSDLVSQEIWLLAHSSEPGALDNASGCCAALEIARCLKTLIDQGSLPPIRRSLRFLHAVEVDGYLPYVAARKEDLRNIIAAIAFDSIGQDFRQGGGSLRLFRSPDANPTFADSLLKNLLKTVSEFTNQQFTSDTYELFSWQVDPFFPGNDNFLADGYFNVPTPMLCNWPDKHYHSNQDTPDRLSRGSLARASIAAAAYLYILAAAETEQAVWLAKQTFKDYKLRILKTPDQAVRLALQGVDALNSLKRLAPLDSSVEEMTSSLQKFACEEAQTTFRWVKERISSQIHEPPHHNIPPGLQEGRLIPERWKFPSTDLLSEAGRSRLDVLQIQHLEITQTWDLLNGQRTIEDILQRTETPPESVLQFVHLILNEKFASLTFPLKTTNLQDCNLQIKPIHSLSSAEKQAKDALLQQVFGDSPGSTVWASNDWIVQVFLGNQLVSQIDIVQRTASIAGETVYLGGIGGVATLPEFRKMGLMKKALRRTAYFLLDILGVDFGFLICSPEMVPFYASLGWQEISNPVTYDQPGDKVLHDGISMVLPCKGHNWLPGEVDLGGYPW